MRKLGGTDLEVSELCLGGNVFGWTADQDASFAVLDAFVERGGNFVDTADSYSAWIPGNEGGESETIIGNWLAARGRRDDVVIATKVGSFPKHPGVTAANIQAAVEDSLRRLQTDVIDVYFAHRDVGDAPLEETLGAFDALVRAGKVRHVGASNYSAPRLAEALEIAAREGFAPYTVLQPNYSLMERSAFEGDLQDLCEKAGVACTPYWSLANGFLTGKYRPRGGDVASARAERAGAYLDERGIRVLEALDEAAAGHDAPVAAIALGWLAAQPSVVSPIASARIPEQLDDLLPVLDLVLTKDEIKKLDDASQLT